jgi:hypothetical protein
MKNFRQFLVSFLVAMVATTLMNCEEEADFYRHFIMRKGEHYATPRLVETLQSNRLAFMAKFGPSCQYYFDEQGFQDSKNKLLGFSDCNSLHHENSARFGWQWLHDRLEIFAYCYVNGQRVEAFVGVVELEKENRYELRIEGGEYVFQLNDLEPVRIQRGSACNTGVYYMLWPYFGGTLPAPHDVHLSIKIIN